MQVEADERCHCGEMAIFSCADCSVGTCTRHYCAGCGRCDRHCVCGYRFWVPFDF
jgi:hypothetical protein